MYAIAYDLDTAALQAHYPGKSYNNAYGEIRNFLAARGFAHQQGSLLYGDGTVTMVSAVLAVTALSHSMPWLRHCVQDIRILQLMVNDDLRPALEV